MMRELLLKTDEEHALNATDLIRALDSYDCEADRRTIYSNVEILQDFGLDVIKKENGQGYYIGSRDFESAVLEIHHREEIAGTDRKAHGTDERAEGEAAEPLSLYPKPHEDRK